MTRHKRKYPWSELDIDETNDIKVIKRAYSLKLKTTRPEDNAAKFQKLVDARDVALQMARGGPWGDFARQAEPVSAPTADPTTTNEIAVRENPSSKSLLLDDGNNIADRIFAVIEDALSQKIDPPDVAEGKSVLRELRIKYPPKQNSWDEKLAEFFDSAMSQKVEVPDVGEVKRRLGEIDNISLSERSNLENRLIGFLSSHIKSLHFQMDGNRTEVSEALKHVVGLLDKEFGWTQNDRRLKDLLPGDSGEFVDKLRSILEHVARSPKERLLGWLVFGTGLLLVLGILFTMSKYMLGG